MEITLYNFTKRRNSTKRPSKGNLVSVNLKEGCSHYNPSFILTTNPTNYSYLSWGSWYYYITDIVNTRNGLWTISCEIDVLATWKDDIKSTSAFVLYSSSNYDTGIPDSRLSTKPNYIVKTNVVTYPIVGNPLYVVTYIGEGGASMKGISETSLKTLQSALSTNAFAELFVDSSKAVSKMLSNTAQAITGCTYVPRCSTTGRPMNIVLAGGYNTGASGTLVNRHDFATTSISIPWNFSSGDFRNRSQYTSLLLLLPCYGYLQLNTDNYLGDESITIDVFQDSATGTIAYKGKDFYCVGNMGCNVQVSTTTQGNLTSGLSSFASAGLQTFTNPIGAIGSLFNAVTSSMATNVGSVGSYGNTIAMDSTLNIEIVVISHDTNVDPSSMAANYGRPCNKVLSLSGLSGYVQTTNANVITWAPKQYKDEIDTLLNGGVYLE